MAVDREEISILGAPETERGTLLRFQPSSPSALRPLSLAVLIHLIERAGRAVCQTAPGVLAWYVHGVGCKEEECRPPWRSVIAVAGRMLPQTSDLM